MICILKIIGRFNTPLAVLPTEITIPSVISMDSFNLSPLTIVSLTADSSCSIFQIVGNYNNGLQNEIFEVAVYQFLHQNQLKWLPDH